MREQILMKSEKKETCKTDEKVERSAVVLAILSEDHVEIATGQKPSQDAADVNISSQHA